MQIFLLTVMAILLFATIILFFRMLEIRKVLLHNHVRETNNEENHQKICRGIANFAKLNNKGKPIDVVASNIQKNNISISYSIDD